MVIRVSSLFKKSYRKLPSDVKEKIKIKESIFRNNPFDSRLNTHKLHGKYKDYWSMAVTLQYRVIFTFDNDNTVDFINVGTHDIYK